MAAHPIPIDISTMPDLVRLTKEVEATQTPLALTRENKIVAVLMPPTQATPKKTRKTSVEEALALAGAWADIPSDDMEEQLDRIRHESKPTPPIDLQVRIKRTGDISYAKPVPYGAEAETPV